MAGQGNTGWAGWGRAGQRRAGQGKARQVYARWGRQSPSEVKTWAKLTTVFQVRDFDADQKGVGQAAPQLTF